MLPSRRGYASGAVDSVAETGVGTGRPKCGYAAVLPPAQTTSQRREMVQRSAFDLSVRYASPRAMQIASQQHSTQARTDSHCNAQVPTAPVDPRAMMAIFMTTV